MSEKQTLVQRAQRALRGEEPWEPIMERITSFVRGDLDAEIAALTEKLRAVEAERDEWKRKYETQCAGSMSAHERRIHLEADLRAELERKDAALKEVLVGDSNISAWGRRIIDAALENLENTDGK